MIKQIAKIALILICIVVAAFAKQPLQTSPQTRPEVFAIIDVNVVPMDREGILEHRTVIVRGDRISEIGATETIEVPAEATRIDGRGKYLMPGLTDMHVHLLNEGITDRVMLSLFLANGVTTVRNMHGSPEILEWRGRIEEGDRVGPRIYTTGPILDGEPPFWQGSIPIETPEEAEQEVAAQKRAGYDGVKVLANISPEAYEAVLAAAARYEIPVYGHAPTRLGLENALNSGQRSFEHMSDFMVALLPDDSPVREQIVTARSDRTKLNPQTAQIMVNPPYTGADPGGIVSLAESAATAGVWICPTLGMSRNFASSPEEFAALQRAPSMPYVEPGKRERWTRIASLFSSDKGDPTAMKRSYRTMLHAVGVMHEAGVPLLVGTDSASLFVVPGFSVHEELEILVDAGLTPYEAIRAATHDAAEFLDALDEWGTVAVGQRADLLLIDGDPLSDIANTTRIAGVMVRGKWLPKAELLKMLEGVAKSYVEQAAQSKK